MQNSSWKAGGSNPGAQFQQMIFSYEISIEEAWSNHYVVKFVY